VNIGDLVEYNKEMPHNRSQNRWGYGIVVDFIDSGFPNDFPWPKIYWPRWNRTSQGPPCYFTKVSK